MGNAAALAWGLIGVALGATTGLAVVAAQGPSWVAASLGALTAAATVAALAARNARRRSRAHERELAVIERALAEREQREAEQARLAEQLRQARKLEAVGQLAGGIAHDFNNLLTAIQGNAELLLLDPELSDDQRADVDEILTASLRGGELVGQLLAFARKSPVQQVALDLHEVVDETLALLRHGLDKRCIVQADLRATGTAVTGDPAQLQNALLNLGVNARDAMPEGGDLIFATRDIEVRADGVWRDASDVPPGAYCEIRVSDSGVGLTPEVRDRLFEPFFTTKGPGRGTGLGLAGVYGCVLNHRGRISVDSTPGEGTTFAILLPIATEARPVTDEAPAVLDEVKRRAGHVLLVEDDEQVREVVGKMLVELGCTFAACVDGLEALEYFQVHHHEVDLVILDMNMPRLDGARTFTELRRVAPGVRVIIMSGRADDAQIRACLDGGALDFLAKPFRIEQLSLALARYGRLQRRPARTSP